jgi:hypothetical protein
MKDPKWFYVYTYLQKGDVDNVKELQTVGWYLKMSNF